MVDVSKIPGARRSIIAANKFTPMLASLPEHNFSREGWIYEPKLDGMRAIAVIKDGSCTLYSRRALPITDQYPLLAKELSRLCKGNAIIDGEIIALNELGRPSFQHLQQRMNLTRRADVERAEQQVPAYFFAFDIIEIEGFDVTSCKLSKRKELLKDELEQSEHIRLLTAFENDGMAAYEVCVENGFEGIVAKRLDSPYEPGRRSPCWIKVKAQQTDEFVVGGFTQGQGGRSSTFGALLLGSFDEKGDFIYCGSVGTGFDERLLRDMCRRMEPLKQPKHAFLKRPDEKKEVTWLNPKIVIEIKFMDWTFDNHLRAPVFLRVREDKGPEDVRLVRRAPQAIVQIDPEKYVSSKTKPTQLTIALDGTPLPDPKAKTARPARKKSSDDITTAKAGTKKQSSTTRSKTRAAARSENSTAEEKPKSAKKRARVGPSIYDPVTVVYKPISPAKPEVCEAVAAQLGATEGDRMEAIVDGDTIELTNLTKVMWPAVDGHAQITKRDFLRYIALTAPYSLAYLRDRPLSVVRSPDGMKGKSFYQKHWNFQIPDYVETCFVEREHDEDTEIAMCNNFASLLWFSQHGVMEHHVWLSRLTLVDPGKKPDFMVFDLDLHFDDEKKDKRLYRKDAFLRVSEAAHWLKEALESVSLNSFLKTSGRNGLHVFVPIENTLEHDEVRTLAEIISKFMLNKHGDKVSIDPIAAKRDGKILVDVSPNCRGKTLIAPYSPRLVKEQSISTPLKWEELGSELPIHHTFTTIPERLKRVGDLWSEWPNYRKDLTIILQKR
jgi:bifunctional non-homologous end joining protein LigD